MRPLAGKDASTKDPFVGQLADASSSDIVVKHNLVIEPEADAPFDPKQDDVLHRGAGPQPRIAVENNLAFKTWAEAGLENVKTFLPLKPSPVLDAASGPVKYMTKDHFNNPRYEGPERQPVSFACEWRPCG